MRRLAPLPFLIALLLLAGCAGEDAAPTAAVAEAAPKAKKVRVVPKKTFVRRLERICRRADMSMGTIGSPPGLSDDVARNRRVVGAWFGRYHKVLRTADRRMARLGMPSRHRLRWRRAHAKLHAMVGHMDTMRAAAWSGSPAMLRLSARQLERTAETAIRRFERFGAPACD